MAHATAVALVAISSFQERDCRVPAGNDTITCPCCALPQEHIVTPNALAMAIRDELPVSAGHVLITPRRHVATFFDATIEKRSTEHDAWHHNKIRLQPATKLSQRCLQQFSAINIWTFVRKMCSMRWGCLSNRRMLAVATRLRVGAIRRSEKRSCSPTNTIIIPRCHIGSFFNVINKEHKALLQLLDTAKVGLDNDVHPTGYNIGVNDGQAGQTVLHLRI